MAAQLNVAIGPKGSLANQWHLEAKTSNALRTQEAVIKPSITAKFQMTKSIKAIRHYSTANKGDSVVIHV